MAEYTENPVHMPSELLLDLEHVIRNRGTLLRKPKVNKTAEITTNEIKDLDKQNIPYHRNANNSEIQTENCNTFSKCNNENVISKKIPPPLPPNPPRKLSRIFSKSSQRSCKNKNEIDNNRRPIIAPQPQRTGSPARSLETLDEYKSNVDDHEVPSQYKSYQLSKTKDTKTKPEPFRTTFDVLNINSETYEYIETVQSHTTTEHKSDLIINELITTEENYIKGLEKILVYKEYLRKIVPLNIRNSVINGLFCNIQDIYEEQKKFLRNLKRRKDINTLNTAFIHMEGLFDLYVTYARNKIKSNRFYKEYEERIINKQKDLNDQLDLSSYLLNPIQRLGRYVLLLEQIGKDLGKRNEDTTHIHSNITKIQHTMRKTNDLLSIDLIQKQPDTLDLTTQGNFILKEHFKLLKPFPKPVHIVAFLFQKVIVFTLPIDSTSECLYLKHLDLSSIALVAREEDQKVFTLTNMIKEQGKDVSMESYELEAEEATIKKHWAEILRKVLWEQFQELKAAEEERRSTLVLSPYTEEVVDYITKLRPLKQLIEKNKFINYPGRKPNKVKLFKLF